jgi:hypothetical protein
MTSKAMTTKREDDFHASAGYHPLTTIATTTTTTIATTTTTMARWRQHAMAILRQDPSQPYPHWRNSSVLREKRIPNSISFSFDDDIIRRH